ncbi:hypothetical protein [Natronoarchaeum rubrum]|uniref:hypothetical protein n=1 Tax=Natronoarchaeum rubrum TaxID=755311 RepID=UPI002112EADB|nr:hypothetical protein [Natronoarchaeum rubrum]
MDFRATRTAGLPLFAGVVNGALAYAAGLIGSFVLFAVFGLKPVLEIVLSASNPPFLTSIGFAFYGGHLVPVQFGDGSALNFALDAANQGALYLLLVAIVLISTGYYLGSADGLESSRSGAMAGATLVAGYLPLAAFGATAFAYERTMRPRFGDAETLVMELPVLRAVVLAGVVVPISLGALGGALAARTDE